MPGTEDDTEPEVHIRLESKRGSFNEKKIHSIPEQENTELSSADHEGHHHGSS